MSADSDRVALRELNRRAREGAVTDEHFGVAVEDPYRCLETESPATTAWVDAQSARTERTLVQGADPGRRHRIEELLSIGRLADPNAGGTRVFYLKRDGRREQPALLVLERGERDARVLVDPQTRGERKALDWYCPSPGGTFVAYGLSDDGDERSTLHVLTVATGRVLDERIARTKWSRVRWLHDESGFYYTRYPAPGEAGFDPDNEDTYFPRVFFHALGSEPSADPLVYGGEAGTDWPGAEVSDDDRWAILTVFHGWSRSDVLLLDRHRAGARPTPVVVGRDNLTTGRIHHGTLFLQTNIDAPRTRIVAVDPAEASRPERWRTIVGEGEWAIEDWVVVGDRILVHTIEEVRSVLRVHTLDGRPEGTVELPDRGSVDGLGGSPSGSSAYVTWSSLLHPPTLFEVDVRSRSVVQLDAVGSDFDTSAFEIEQADVVSKDGTIVNVWLAHARGMARDGSNPVLLTGYGGFNASMLPGFARNVLYWLERGGVYAIANLRGGGERGEEWHRAGNLGNKERVFEDFEAVIRWFSTSGISAPDRIAITGGSNGGLLMGAMITRVPDQFAAAASYVGLYDMLRYDRFPPAELWISEYGSARASEEQFRWLHAYSPCHRVRTGVDYPAVLVETADRDSRVHWAHSTKFAALLQEATAGDRPIYFYMDRQVGHGAGTGRTDLLRRFDRLYAFLEAALPMPPRVEP